MGEGRSLTEGRPSGGELFLGGIDDEGLWFQAAGPGTADCPFGISSNAWDDGDGVIFESGLRLSKADGFIGEPSVLSGGPPPIVCMKQDGEAIESR